MISVRAVLLVLDDRMMTTLWSATSSTSTALTSVSGKHCMFWGSHNTGVQ